MESSSSAYRSASVDGSPVLSARQVAKTFFGSRGTSSHAIDEATLSIAEKEFVSLVGPSGCGKTTLLRILAGLSNPTRGLVEYREVPEPPPPDHQGIVFQSPALLPWRSVLRNVLLPAEVLGMDIEVARARASQLLEMVQLQGAENKYPSELSGGMQQRVAIARALLSDPPLLFMDEPFGALDAMTREDMNAELQSMHMQQQKTVFFVTHSISEAVFLSDRIYVMSAHPGKIIADIPVPFQRPRSRTEENALAFGELERRVRAVVHEANVGTTV